jgi:uncharacterized protein (DUF1501 family)
MSESTDHDKHDEHEETGDRISRRKFLAGAGIATTAAVAGGWGLTVWRRDETGSSSGPRAGELGGAAGLTLVIVEMGGGNDGLNTVVPLNDVRYHDLRPTLAVQKPISIDRETGFHDKLVKLAARFKDGHVAVVEGVGYPNPDLSHFASLANWWSAAPGESGKSGWIGRYLDGTVGFHEPLAGVAIGPSPSPAIRGDRSFATSISDATGLQPRLPEWIDRRDDLVAAWRGFAPAHVDAKTQLGRVEQAVGLTGKARTTLDRTLRGYQDPAAAGRTSGAAGRGNNANATANPITESLSLAAQLVASKAAPRVVYVSGLGDFDTHQGEAQRHPALMADLDAGVETFFSRLAAAHATDRALLMTVSEFGRRPNENGSGTDHGTAAPHFFIGSKVKGGRYGERPSLSKLDQSGNLAHTVDFRSLYATALKGWLGVDPEPVLGKRWETLPVLTT